MRISVKVNKRDVPLYAYRKKSRNRRIKNCDCIVKFHDFKVMCSK